MARGIGSPGSSTLLQVSGADPAAGVEVSQTVPAGMIWELISVSVVLVQGITDQPQPMLTIDDGGTNVIFESFGSTTFQAVSTTCRYTWAADLVMTGQVGATTNVHSIAPLPEELLLKGGYRIRTTTIGLTATGNYGVPSFYVVQYNAG